MRRLRYLSLALILAACGGTRSQEQGASLDPDTEKLIDALTLFVESVQGDRFDKALGYLTPEEAAKMTEGSGQVSPGVQKQLKALRLSTLASKSGVRLENGKLTGIQAWLPNIEQAAPGAASVDSTPPLIQ